MSNTHQNMARYLLVKDFTSKIGQRLKRFYDLKNLVYQPTSLKNLSQSNPRSPKTFMIMNVIILKLETRIKKYCIEIKIFILRN